eukprot:CAMPEP_0115001878 /NCGR_PEP_ID=MMETSP0216-20121206/17669_1 /TAXON_ID=223996 /ORGANISM="Protocruzia adherens, Strain Boccale" /LENGTH=312 /DNA_ID=CAMNT_0002367359 /DNA_START=150 /DNA_END=1084 /DNA_ORIENTATION=+
MVATFGVQLEATLWKQWKIKVGSSSRNIIKEFIVPVVFSGAIIGVSQADKGIAQNLVAIYLPFCFLQYFRSLLYHLVEEKTERIKEFLKILGQRNSVYVLGWIISESIYGLLLALIISFMLCAGQVYSFSLFGWSLLIIWLYTFSGIQFGFCVSSFFDEPKIASQGGSFLFIIPLALYYAIPHIDIHALKILICLFPQPALIQGISGLTSLIQGISGLTSPPPSGILDKGTICWVLAMDAVIYFILSIYLSQVIPNQYGISKPWHFPISAIFGSKASSEVNQEAIPINQRDPSKVSSALFEEEDEKTITEKP